MTQVLSWDDSEGVLYLVNLDVNMRYNVELIGVKDNSNRTYTTPDYFNPDTIRVYHNGRRLAKTTKQTAQFGSFYVTESGGAGTGYDTVVITRFSPHPNSGLWTDYHVQA